MRWSQMNTAQRAFLQNGAKFAKDTIVNGKVVRRGEPLNTIASVMVAAKAADRDHDRRNAKLAKAEMREAILALGSAEEIAKLATKLPPGNAYGHNALSRRHATAMPMQFYHGTGYGS